MLIFQLSQVLIVEMICVVDFWKACNIVPLTQLMQWLEILAVPVDMPWRNYAVNDTVPGKMRAPTGFVGGAMRVAYCYKPIFYLILRARNLQS